MRHGWEVTPLETALFIAAATLMPGGLAMLGSGWLKAARVL